MLVKEEISEKFRQLQDRICGSLEGLDQSVSFHQDEWIRKGGGGGRSRILAGGKVIEKGGVNFSEVFGDMPGFMTSNSPDEKSKLQFYATGVSIVIHPLNPWVPIIHMNVRYFQNSDNDSWFGGGIDLTPHYVDQNDAKLFHGKLEALCDNHKRVADYKRFKEEADEYFFIPHRNETRGIGGIFFDHLRAVDEQSKTETMNFVLDLGNLFAPLYTNLVKRNANKEFNDLNKKWQRLRRGRYVEFNLVYDRGTKFGLETNGRTESILMSLPPQADWCYNYIPESGSMEAETLSFLKKGINWNP